MVELENMKKKDLFHQNHLDKRIMFKFTLTILFLLTISSSLYADQKDKRLNYLFDKLVVAKEEKEINKITNQIWKIWHEIDDPKTTRDFETGVQMMNLGYYKRSIDYFDKVILNKPNFAEAWNKRATAHFMMGNFDLSMQDIGQTLQLEPRHFGALDGMGLIFIHTNQYEKAIEIYDKMLEIFPNSIGTKLKKEKMLSLSTKST